MLNEAKSAYEQSIVELHDKILDELSSVKVDLEFRDLLEAISAAVYTVDVDGRITFYNQAAVDLWGHRPLLGEAEWCGSWRLFWPDGRPMAHDECPMATALRERRRISGAEAIAQRPDGTLVPFLAFPTPLYDKGGVLTGALNVLLDITEWKRTEQSEWLLSAIFESCEDAILTVGLDGTVTSCNPGARRLFGYTAEELVGQPVSVLSHNGHFEDREFIERVIQGGSVNHYEAVRRRKDGALVDISVAVSPIRNSKGQIIGFSKIARDITERKRAEQQQLLLLEEMNHRVKNVFALTGSLITLSARSAKSPKELDDAVRSRLGALARAHELTLPIVTPTELKPAQPSSLDELVNTVFAPYTYNGAEHDRGRFSARGPNVQVGGKALTSMALLLHEFATNAAKYGALSDLNGHVDMSWAIESNMLELTWAERGGPTLAGEPESEGFGGILARTTVTGQLGGRLSRDWAPDGLVIRLSVPLARLLA